MPEKRRGTEPQQQGPLLGTAVATVASSDDPGVRPPPGPRSLAPPLSAEEVSLGDSREHGGASRARAELDSSKIESKQCGVQGSYQQLPPLQNQGWRWLLGASVAGIGERRRRRPLQWRFHGLQRQGLGLDPNGLREGSILASLVRNTTSPVESGRQGSEATTALLRDCTRWRSQSLPSSRRAPKLSHEHANTKQDKRPVTPNRIFYTCGSPY